MMVRRRSMRWASALSAGLVSLFEMGCPAGEPTPPPGAAAAGKPGATARAGAAGASGATRVKAPFAPEPWRIPVGPRLLIEPGAGLGPIRFGARVDTVERLIGQPCEEKRELPSGDSLCRYSSHAIELELRAGEVARMRVHRLGRIYKAEPKIEFGIFNGQFANGAGVGMLRSAVREMFGPPKATRAVTDPNPFGTVEIDEHDGFRLEYDQVGPDRVVLGGVELTGPNPAQRAAKAAQAPASGNEPVRATPAPTPPAQRNPIH